MSRLLLWHKIVLGAVAWVLVYLLTFPTQAMHYKWAEDQEITCMVQFNRWTGTMSLLTDTPVCRKLTQR